MSALVLDNKNIILLGKLEMEVRRESGCRFNLSDELSLTALLRSAAESSNVSIKLAFIKFYESLTSEEKNKLVALGITKIEKQDQRTYRGVKIGSNRRARKETPSADDIPEEIASAHALDLTRSKELPKGVVRIVYRGSVVYKKDGVIIKNPLEELFGLAYDGTKTKP